MDKHVSPNLDGFCCWTVDTNDRRPISRIRDGGESRRGNDPCLMGGSLVTQVFRAVITIMVGTVR